MLKKEHLLPIKDLKFAMKADSMSDADFKAYVQSLNSFIDGFPAQASKLRAAVEEKSYSALSRTLSEVCDVLRRILALDIAQEGRAQITKLQSGSVNHDAAEAFVEQFILRISSLSIDVQMAEHAKPAAPPPPRPAAAHTGRQAKVFAVDNAVMFLNTLTKLLQDHPYDLNCTTSVTEALQYLQNNRPDVILLDIEMPEMDGYELARRIKQGGQRAPIIFITANSAREYVDKAVAVGAAGLLMKPLRINQLLAKLKEFA